MAMGGGGHKVSQWTLGQTGFYRLSYFVLWVLVDHSHVEILSGINSNNSWYKNFISEPLLSWALINNKNVDNFHFNFGNCQQTYGLNYAHLSESLLKSPW